MNAAPTEMPDLQIDNDDADDVDKEWIPNVQFDSNKPMWAKYRYRQVEKNTFQQAKEAAFKLEALDGCPVEVIRRFINRSWRWMSAYRMGPMGLTGEAAQWAVRKQKGHHSVSRTAMMHLDAVLN
jgi:hypothetical protein